MDYESLVRLAVGAAALAAEARILGQDGAAFNLVEAGDTLERAAVQSRVPVADGEAELEEQIVV